MMDQGMPPMGMPGMPPDMGMGGVMPPGMPPQGMPGMMPGMMPAPGMSQAEFMPPGQAEFLAYMAQKQMMDSMGMAQTGMDQTQMNPILMALLGGQGGAPMGGGGY